MHMGTHGKPHPQIFQLTAARLNVPAEACLVIEDSLAGVQAAKAASMQVIAVPDTRLDREEFQSLADLVLDSLAQWNWRESLQGGTS